MWNILTWIFGLCIIHNLVFSTTERALLCFVGAMICHILYKLEHVKFIIVEDVEFIEELESNEREEE